MLNKALFKQSCKANWIKWLCVTLSTCIMLAIVIIVLGNLSINDIRDSLKNVFVQANQEAYIKENTIDSYDLYLSTVEQYNQNAQLSNGVPELINQYNNKIQKYKSDNEGVEPPYEIKMQYVEEVATGASVMLPSQNPEIIKGYVTAILVYYIDNPTIAPANVYDEYFLEQIYLQAYKQSYDEAIEDEMTEQEAVNYATMQATSAKALSQKAITQYKGDVANEGASYVYSKERYKSYAQTETINTISQGVYNQQIAMGESEDVAKQYAASVKVISNTSISTYEFWLNQYEESDLENPITEEQIALAKAEACKSISDEIPEKVAVALEELGNMDMNGLIIGSIFYRIAGLLLPMVFVIMAANGLLAGQVDSGSMAYVLSTPTKRRTVTSTQLAFLITSLFAMFALLTIVSVISVWIVGGNDFAINYQQILLFNLGAFLTMFAIAGFCFMCSAIFNRTKHSLSIGGGLTIFSLVCTILGLFGSEVVPSAMRISAMNFFNYLSIITLFDTVAIMANDLSYLWKFGTLLVFGIICIIIGIFRFDKKDLPL